VQTATFTNIEDGDDIRMAGQQRCRGRFLLETSDDARVLRQVIGKDLDRKQAPMKTMPRQQNLRHASSANPAKHLVLVADDALDVRLLLLSPVHPVSIYPLSVERPRQRTHK